MSDDKVKLNMKGFGAEINVDAEGKPADGIAAAGVAAIIIFALAIGKVIVDNSTNIKNFSGKVYKKIKDSINKRKNLKKDKNEEFEVAKDIDKN